MRLMRIMHGILCFQGWLEQSVRLDEDEERTILLHLTIEFLALKLNEK